MNNLFSQNKNKQSEVIPSGSEIIKNVLDNIEKKKLNIINETFSFLQQEFYTNLKNASNSGFTKFSYIVYHKNFDYNRVDNDTRDIIINKFKEWVTNEFKLHANNINIQYDSRTTSCCFSTPRASYHFQIDLK